MKQNLKVVLLSIMGALSLGGAVMGGVALGNSGKPGEQGLPGPSGQPGINGTDGTSVLTGSGEPANTLGKNGDSYIDLTTWDFYVKANGTWGKSGNIKGETGAAGEKGSNGSAGSDGKSAYEIYCEQNPTYNGTEAEWSAMFDEFLNKSNISYDEFKAKILGGYGGPYINLNNYDACPSYNHSQGSMYDWAPVEDLVVTIDTQYAYQEVNYDYDTEQNVVSDVVLTSNVVCKSDMSNYDYPIIEIQADMEMVINGSDPETYLKDKVVLAPVCINPDAENQVRYFMFFFCDCPGYWDEKCFIEIDDDWDFNEITEYVYRTMIETATVFQFERAGANVLDDEGAVYYEGSIASYANRIANSKFFKTENDDSTTTYSMINDNATHGFNYSYTLDEYGYAISANTVINGFSDSNGVITSSTKIDPNISVDFSNYATGTSFIDTEQDNFETITFDGVECVKYDDYDFGDVVYHSAATILDASLFETYDNGPYDYKHDHEIVRLVVENSCSTLYQNQSEFDPSLFYVHAVYDDGYDEVIPYDETNNNSKDGYSIINNTIPFDYESGIIYGYGTYEVRIKYLDFIVSTFVYIAPEATPINGCVIDAEHNFKIGDNISELTQTVEILYSDGHKEIKEMKVGDADGYVLDTSSLPVDESNNFNDVGIYEIVVYYGKLAFTYYIFISPAA